MTFEGKTMDFEFDDWYGILQSLARKHGENVSDEDAWRESFDDGQWPEACGQLVPISVEECLPKAIGESEPWSDEVIVYTKRNEKFIAYYEYEFLDWFDKGHLVTDVTHWLPIPEI